MRTTWGIRVKLQSSRQGYKFTKMKINRHYRAREIQKKKLFDLHFQMMNSLKN